MGPQCRRLGSLLLLSFALTQLLSPGHTQSIAFAKADAYTGHNHLTRDSAVRGVPLLRSAWAESRGLAARQQGRNGAGRALRGELKIERTGMARVLEAEREVTAEVYPPAPVMDFPGVVFYGDSLTEGWSGVIRGHTTNPMDKDVFDAMAAELGLPYMFIRGVGGDTSMTLLWRLQRGDLIPGVRLAVVCIGIGNIIKKKTPVEEVPTQVMRAVWHIRRTQPYTRVLLQALLPESITVKFNSSEVDERLAGVNEELEKLVGEAGDPYISFVSCHKDFLAEEGTLDTALYASDGANFVHLSPAGYTVWAKCLTPVIQGLLQTIKNDPEPVLEKPRAPAAAPSAAGQGAAPTQAAAPVGAKKGVAPALLDVKQALPPVGAPALA